MLLLFVTPPVAGQPHNFHQLFSPDRLFALGQHFLMDVLPKLVVIFVLAWVAIRVLGFFTDRMARIAEKHGSAATRISQARTLSSVLRATGIAIIGFLAVMMMLPILGFNLAPLLASAGVAGVAIGLACQTIVKDCLNGMLFLIEDQFNVGDWIVATGVTGQVEAMSLRKTTLRGGDGVLYLIPNSQITTVANKTRDWSMALVSVEVDFSADPDEVIKVLLDTAMSVRNDPAYKDAFIADPTVLGVDDIKGSQLTYPVVLKTLANQQWGIKREFQRRVRLALEEHHLLPGHPLHVFTPQGSQTAAVMLPGAPAAPPPVDPTALGANEINPFTGEGM
jgi:small-conductance mechanosensitive channel